MQLLFFLKRREETASTQLFEFKFENISSLNTFTANLINQRFIDKMEKRINVPNLRGE